jgi:hypothetical protein
MQFAKCSVFHSFHITRRPLWEELWNAATLAEHSDEDSSGDDENRAEQKAEPDELGLQK